MVKYENQCVGCPPEMGCIGSSCRYRDVPVYYCDECGAEGAEYQIDDCDLCENCAKKYLQEAFDDLTLSEKAEMLNIYMRNIE